MGRHAGSSFDTDIGSTIVVLVYRLLFNLIVRRLPAEFTHNSAILLLRMVAHLRPVRLVLLRYLAPEPILRTEALGLEFNTPIGVAAGFDKDAKVFPALHALGFGFIEVGTVTAQPQRGNPKPRLFRLPVDRALINRMGFNNEGALAASARLKRTRRHAAVVVGGNIGKTKAVAMRDVIHDYEFSAQALAEGIDYLVVNVSSPNTPGLRGIEIAPELASLVIAVRQAVNSLEPPRALPILLKISPELTSDQVDHIADLTNRLKIDGIVATNTSSRRRNLRTNPDAVAALGPGGLSGPPLRPQSLDILRRLRARVSPDVAIISVGGLETAQDAFDRILAGANLVQAYTGFVYGGPLWVHRLNKELACLLKMHHFAGVNDAIGRRLRPASE